MGLNEMKRLLAPLGLYRLEDDDKITGELRAYAAGMEMLNRQLNELEREAFVPTAIDFGLTLREQLFGGSPEGLDVPRRRQRIIGRLAQVRGAWSRKRVEDSAEEAAPGVRLLEDCAGQTLIATGIPRGETPDWYRPLWGVLDAGLPAQLRLRLDTDKPDWNRLDACNYTADELDYLGYPWDVLEEPEERSNAHAQQQ